MDISPENATPIAQAYWDSLTEDERIKSLVAKGYVRRPDGTWALPEKPMNPDDEKLDARIAKEKSESIPDKEF